MKVLLTGASGFLGRHVLDCLLTRGHEVVGTVRSDGKAQQISAQYPEFAKQLCFKIVEDMSRPDAFDKVVQDDSIQAVLHMASPFHYEAKDPKADMIDPAINSTTGILKSALSHGKSVQRVVITSSFASVMNMAEPVAKYDEHNWNPITMEQSLGGGMMTYVGSKKFAEKAAWDSMKEHQPNFILSTVNPLLVFGPVKERLQSLSNINTSNQIFADIIQGTWALEIPEYVFKFVDVRDVALAHVRALEIGEDAASGRRFLAAAGSYSNLEIAQILRKEVPELTGRIAEPNTALPATSFEIDTSGLQEILGIQPRSLTKSVVDTVKSLLDTPI